MAAPSRPKSLIAALVIAGNAEVLLRDGTNLAAVNVVLQGLLEFGSDGPELIDSCKKACTAWRKQNRADAALVRAQLLVGGAQALLARANALETDGERSNLVFADALAAFRVLQLDFNLADNPFLKIIFRLRVDAFTRMVNLLDKMYDQYAAVVSVPLHQLPLLALTEQLCLTVHSLQCAGLFASDALASLKSQMISVVNESQVDELMQAIGDSTTLAAGLPFGSLMQLVLYYRKLIINQIPAVYTDLQALQPQFALVNQCAALFEQWIVHHVLPQPEKTRSLSHLPCSDCALLLSLPDFSFFFNEYLQNQSPPDYRPPCCMLCRRIDPLTKATSHALSNCILNLFDGQPGALGLLLDVGSTNWLKASAAKWAMCCSDCEGMFSSQGETPFALWLREFFLTSTQQPLPTHTPNIGAGAPLPSGATPVSSLFHALIGNCCRVFLRDGPDVSTHPSFSAGMRLLESLRVFMLQFRNGPAGRTPDYAVIEQVIKKVEQEDSEAQEEEEKGQRHDQLNSLRTAFVTVPLPRLYCFPSPNLPEVIKQKRWAGLTTIGTLILSVNVPDLSVPVAYMHLVLYGLHFLLFDGDDTGARAVSVVLADVKADTLTLYSVCSTATNIFLHNDENPIRSSWPAFINQNMRHAAVSQRDNQDTSGDLAALATDEKSKPSIEAALGKLKTHPSIQVPFSQRNASLLPGFVAITVAFEQRNNVTPQTFFSFIAPKLGVTLVAPPFCITRNGLQYMMHLFHDPGWRERTRHPKTNAVLTPPPDLMRVALIIHIRRSETVAQILSYQLTHVSNAISITPLGGRRFVNRDRHVPRELLSEVPRLAENALISCKHEIQLLGRVNDELSLLLSVAEGHLVSSDRDVEPKPPAGPAAGDESDPYVASMSIVHRLAASGLERVPADGDGNCLFHAVAGQLGGSHTAASVRKDVATFWSKPGLWPADMVAQLMNDLADLPVINGQSVNSQTQYASYIKESGNYGTDTDIGVIAHIYTVRIMLHIEEAPENAEPAMYGTQGEQKLHLIHCGRLEEAESHFDGAKPLQ